MPETWPVMSIAEAHRLLTQPGSRLEIEETVIRGIPTKVWKNAPPTLRDVFLNARAFKDRERYHRFPLYHFAMVMWLTVTLVTGLHVVEATIWAAAFLLIGAMPNPHAAMLYSISAMTAYGHAQVYLEDHWQMLGALESLTGLILFGLTTAFLYGMIQRAWPGRDK